MNLRYSDLYIKKEIKILDTTIQVHTGNPVNLNKNTPTKARSAMKTLNPSLKLIKFQKKSIYGKYITVLSPIILVIFISLSNLSCTRKGGENQNSPSEEKQEVIVKKRNDGTVSSVNQVDDKGNVHGKRITYYADGKTIYSRLNFSKGIKNGPARWYYKNGQLSLSLNYLNGIKEGPSKRYYKSGKLMSETNYAADNPLPGLKEYDMDGVLITKYSTVSIRENYRLGSSSKVVLELTCSRKSDKVKFYIMDEENGNMSRVYLISENGSAVKRFSLSEGEVINREIKFLVEIPTDLGNTLVKELSYHLDARNLTP